MGRGNGKTGKSVGRNPAPGTRGQVRQARQLFKDFRGDAPEGVKRVKLPTPKTALAVGKLDGILYTTVRDGKTEKYIHEFRKSSRPTLAVGNDGKHLIIVGGRYRFTNAGIEDR